MAKPKLLLVLSFVLLASLVLLAGNLARLQANAMDKIGPGLRDEMLAAGEDAYWVYLAEQADLSGADAISDWSKRGSFVYNTLLETAHASQADIVNLLDQEQTTGNVSRFQSFFIVNAILVTSNVNTLDALAAHADVARLEPSRSYEIQPVIDDVNPGQWEHADEVRESFGIHGEGMVVGSIGTGVDYQHPALVDQYRGNLDGGVFDHNFNWYDPSLYPCPTPCDASSMGMHTVGDMVGDDGSVYQAPPKAKWIAVRGCDGLECSDFALLFAAEWMLAPCPSGVSPGNPACNSDKRPHVMNNPWDGYIPWMVFWMDLVQAWHAAGISLVHDW